MQQNQYGSFKFYDYTDPGNVYSGGVISHPTKLICCETDTPSPAADNKLMWLESTYAYFKILVLYTSCDIQLGGVLKTNRMDEKILFTTTQYIFRIHSLLRYWEIMEPIII